jgi:hypothetical protein
VWFALCGFSSGMSSNHLPVRRTCVLYQFFEEKKGLTLCQHVQNQKFIKIKVWKEYRLLHEYNMKYDDYICENHVNPLLVGSLQYSHYCRPEFKTTLIMILRKKKQNSLNVIISNMISFGDVS